jgi:glycosyltransferase involved in cell wall biosynthesis
MRVVHLVPALFGPDGIVGGAERYACELARHMADVVPTTLVSFGAESREKQVGRLRVRVIGDPWLVRKQRTNPFSRAIFGELRLADVVHCHQQHVLASSAAAAWARLNGRRVFVSDLGGGGWDVSAYISTDRWFHGHLHLSEYSRRIFGHELNPAAHVIGGGVDVQKFSPVPRAAAHRDVLFVGRLLPHKGIDDLIRALPQGMSLRIVGPEPDTETRALLADLARGKDVTFLHRLDDTALVREYQQALCIVLPSVYQMPDGRQTMVPELLGQTLLEGMACGIPAVCTRVGSMPEVVSDGITGLVVPPNDPSALGERLTWLSAHPDKVARMGAAARRHVLERFTWPAVVSRCLAQYDAVSSRSARRTTVMVTRPAQP